MVFFRSAMVFGLAFFGTVLPADDAPEEFRAAWVARFEWASPDGKKCRANITRILDALAANHFNAVVFQVRGAAETLYPSSLEPWSPLVGKSGPGFDPLEFAVREAHQRGIQLHAYVNPMPLRSAGRRAPPSDGRHLWFAHGPGSPEPWICVDREGEPATTEYYYLSPGVPEVHAYLRRVILDLVRRYDVDGVHFDRIRYPGRQYSHDKISQRRFGGPGNPNRKDWEDWRREQLDKFINDVAAEIREEKPRLVISCAAWGIYNRNHVAGYGEFSSGFHDYGQDTWNWVRLGAMDVLMPMIYWDLADPKPNYDELVSDFIRGVGREHLVGGQRVFSPEENVRQIRLTRDAGALGTVLWSFGAAQRKGVLSHLKQTLYTSKASVPKVPRLTNPANGVLLGTVKDSKGKPIVDAWVSIDPIDVSLTRKGVFAQTWTTSADGRFAFLKVPPGPVRITVRQASDRDLHVGPMEVKRGEVTRCEAVVQDATGLRQRPAAGSPHATEPIQASDARSATPLKDPLAMVGLFTASAESAENPGSATQPHALQEALELLDDRPDWTELPDLNVPVHPAEKYLNGMTIVLDPGHGGGRPRPDQNREADMNFRVARLLEKLLRRAGVIVIMTRDRDVEVSLADRAAIANSAERPDGEKGADLFVSIHHNAGGRTANYSSVWFHGEADWSEPDLDIARYVGHALGEALRTDVGRTSPLMSDQQMYPSGFGVLRQCEVPAILLECSFFSNPDENRRLRDAFYNLSEAYAVYRGLCQYAYGGRPTQSTPTASVTNGVLRVETVLDDGLPAEWWGGDRNRILTSTISVCLNDRHMDISFDGSNKKLTATVDGLSHEDLTTGVLQIHFANFFKHHNWPQRFSLRCKASDDVVLCSPMAARRHRRSDD